MKNFALLVIFLAFNKNVVSWYGIEYLNFTKETTDECHSADPNMETMRKGDFKQLNDCVQAVCGDKGILYLGCKEIEKDDNCTSILEGNTTMPYPDCCSKCVL